MRRLGGWGRWWGATISAVAAAPALALVAAAWVDHGPDGGLRWTAFPAALAALDPFVWDCARNSLVMAAAVTLTARGAGVGLARVTARWRFWGRTPVGALAAAGAVVPPAFAALGLRAAFGPPEAWPVPTAGTLWGPWLAWYWVGVTTATPVVWLATADRLRRVDPVWEDAARLAGASRRQVWRRVVWPFVRPRVAASLGLVFTLTLFEPGAPLVLGLRRTLAYQAAESALSGGVGALPRAAVLALSAAAVSFLVRVMIGWWGGSDHPAPPTETGPSPRPVAATWPRASSYTLCLGLAALTVWLPLAGLAVAALTPATGTPVDSLVHDPLTRGYVFHSLVLGGAAVGVGLAVARSVGTPRWPPLAIGVGVLALPALLGGVARALPASSWRPSPAQLLGTAADAFDPGRTPWVALVLAVALAHVPLRAGTPVARQGQYAAGYEAAISLGATPRRARRAVAGRGPNVSPGAVLFAAALAATNVSPALLFAATADVRPVGPAVLALVDEPGGLPRAAALALAAVAVNLTGLAAARYGRAPSSIR